jgi:hypothetical protein
MVVTPSLYDRIEGSDNLLLRGGSHLSQLALDLLGVVFDGLLAWAYERLVSERPSMGVLTRVGFPHRILPHVKTQEVEAYVSIDWMERVRDPCFARMQLQAHVL